MILKTIGAKIDGIFTDIVLGDYENRLFVVISQANKFGSIVRIEKEIFQASESQENIFNVQTIFGKEDDENTLLARILAEKIETTKSVVCITYLKEHTARTTRALLLILNENKIW